MAKPYSTARIALILASLLPGLIEIAPVSAADPGLDQMPTFDGQPILLAGTGMRGSSRSGSGSSLWPFGKKSSLPKEDGSQYVDPDFEDVVGPAGQSKAAGQRKPATGLIDRFIKKPNAAASESETKTQAAGSQQSNGKPTATPDPKANQPSVEELLKEMYVRDGREVPDLEYKPVPIDNPAVRAARVERGLPAVPPKRQPQQRSGPPLSNVQIALDGKGTEPKSAAEMDAEDFFPADAGVLKPATPLADAAMFFPEDVAIADVSAEPAAIDLSIPAADTKLKNVSEVFDLAPINTPVAIQQESIGRAATNGSGGIEIPTAEIALPQVPMNGQVAARNPSPNPILPPAPGQSVSDWSAVQQRVTAAAPAGRLPQVQSQAAISNAAASDASGWRVAERAMASAANAATGWQSPRTTSATPSNEPTVTTAARSNDPIDNAFDDNEQMVAAGESLDITPAPLDVTPERTAVLEPLRNRENLTGLKGFCPVTLCEHRDLIDADPRYSAVYQDRTYYVSTYEALKLFQEQPEKYAPVAAGSDVVRLRTDNVDVEGILDHAAWYRGRLYLFESATTLAVFSANPREYAVQ